MKLPLNLLTKIEDRKQNLSLRSLGNNTDKIDFSSNDYIGFAKNKIIYEQTNSLVSSLSLQQNGATGSRLLTGNHQLYNLTETLIANFHATESALIFNSGYDANIGFFGCVPQRNDVVFYDNLCHASIRDGISLGNAKSFKFLHNDTEDLQNQLLKIKQNPVYTNSNIYIVTESVFSMDGDMPNLLELSIIADNFSCYLVIDEAHALGVVGENGAGLVQELQLQKKIFARIVTFGKGLGCHGAAIVGNADLVEYLVNFCRSFIYSTGLSPHSVAAIYVGYQSLVSDKESILQLRENIIYFNQQKKLLGLNPLFVRSKSAIQSCIIPTNEKVKKVATFLNKNGFDVRPILSPTVPEGQERLRFCLHNYNTTNQISEGLKLLATIIFE